ncbi:TPA: hypothetical protein ACKPXH_003941 [Pseudomonas aeruginosa]
MPEIKCHAGHTMSVSTDEWIGQLSLDQMRYACDQMAAKIKKAEEQPKRIVWRVCTGMTCAGNYREEDFEKAADHFLRIFKGVFMDEAADYVAKPYGTLVFSRQLPSLEPELVTQLEYETEWFPNKKESSAP